MLLADNTVAPDPTESFVIRITGGQFVPGDEDDVKVGTFLYAYEMVFFPNDANPDLTPSRPTGLGSRFGPRSDDDQRPQAAIEESGSGAVPTDGSVYVTAWYDDATGFVVFQYDERMLWMRILGQETTSPFAYYAAEQVVPIFNAGSGWSWGKPDGGVESKEGVLADGTSVAKNPLVEISGRNDIQNGAIVQAWRYARRSRADESSSDNYLDMAPQVDVSFTDLGGSGTSTIQAVKVTGASGGSYTLTLIDSDGNPIDETDDITIGSTVSEVEDIIQAIDPDATCSGTDASDFTVTFAEGDDPTPLMQADGSSLFSDSPLYFIGPPATKDLIEVALTSRRATSDPDYEYAWTGTDSSGSLKAYGQVVQTQVHDGLNPDIHTVTLYGATGGTFTLTDSGGSPTAAIAWNAGHATIEALLTHFTVTGSGSPWTLTGTDGSAHTLGMDDSLLTPAASHSPARFLNPTPMNVPVRVGLRLKSGRDPYVTSLVRQVGNGTTNPTIIRLKRRDVADGALHLRFDGAGSFADVAWNADAAAIQTALTALLGCTVAGVTSDVFDITITADDAPHQLDINADDVFGTKLFTAYWSNGNICTGPFGGVEMTLLDSYSGPLSASVSVSPAGSSVGPWTITVSNATSGTYQVTVDGGSPVDTAYSACPVLAGFTVTTNPDGSCHVVGSGGSHTLLVYGAKLRSSVPKQVPFLIDGCCVLVPVDLCVAGDS